MTPYRDFAELVLHTIKDQDYRFVITNQSADVTVASIHGGGIEPLTSELAAAIADKQYNLYDLRGLRAQGNDLLRIPVHHFDEVRLRSLMQRSQVGVGIQGIAGSDTVVHLGGSNKRLREIVRQHLEEAGFETGGPVSMRASHDPALFFNWPARGGVQIELTTTLREQMAGGPLEGFAWEDASRWQPLFHTFVKAVRAALAAYRAEVKGDLKIALDQFEYITSLIPRSLRDHRHNGHEE
ncbi:MAG: hypothetical protein GX552_06330 [Chloroflexi bacterium]|jgi:phage replication-related protein YjqB (UPF0714/DUF867 family)|nr:hypothetical protein [Chloroflexota bacterium]